MNAKHLIQRGEGGATFRHRIRGNYYLIPHSTAARIFNDIICFKMLPLATNMSVGKVRTEVQNPERLIL